MSLRRMEPQADENSGAGELRRRWDTAQVGLAWRGGQGGGPITCCWAATILKAAAVAAVDAIQILFGLSEIASQGIFALHEIGCSKL